MLNAPGDRQPLSVCSFVYKWYNIFLEVFTVDTDDSRPNGGEGISRSYRALRALLGVGEFQRILNHVERGNGG